MNYVGLFEIQILIVLPIFEHETIDLLSMDMHFMFFSNKNRFVVTPVTWPISLLRQIGVRISLALEQIFVSLEKANRPEEELKHILGL